MVDLETQPSTTLSLENPIPTNLVEPNMLPLRTSNQVAAADETIARALAKSNATLMETIQNTLGIKGLGDMPIAGTPKDPRVSSATTTTEADVDAENDTSTVDNYKKQAAIRKRNQILKLTGQDNNVTVASSTPTVSSTPTATYTPSSSGGGGGGGFDHAAFSAAHQATQNANMAAGSAAQKSFSDYMSDPSNSKAIADNAAGVQRTKQSIDNLSRGIKTGFSEGGLTTNPKKKTNSKKRGLAARK